MSSSGVDTDEMRLKAAECREYRDIWLQAAEQWEQLAKEVDAWRKRMRKAADAAKGEDDPP